MSEWLTNDPEIAKRLRAVDRAWEKARAKAQAWPLDLKVSAYRKADEARAQAYERIRASIEATP